MMFLILTAAAFGSCVDFKCETEKVFDDIGDLALTIYSQKRSNANDIKCEDPTKCKPSECCAFGLYYHQTFSQSCAAANLLVAEVELGLHNEVLDLPTMEEKRRKLQEMEVHLHKKLALYENPFSSQSAQSDNLVEEIEKRTTPGAFPFSIAKEAENRGLEVKKIIVPNEWVGCIALRVYSMILRIFQNANDVASFRNKISFETVPKAQPGERIIQWYTQLPFPGIDNSIARSMKKLKLWGGHWMMKRNDGTIHNSQPYLLGGNFIFETETKEYFLSPTKIAIILGRPTKLLDSSNEYVVRREIFRNLALQEMEKVFMRYVGEYGIDAMESYFVEKLALGIMNDCEKGESLEEATQSCYITMKKQATVGKKIRATQNWERLMYNFLEVPVFYGFRKKLQRSRETISPE